MEAVRGNDGLVKVRLAEGEAAPSQRLDPGQSAEDRTAERAALLDAHHALVARSFATTGTGWPGGWTR